MKKCAKYLFLLCLIYACNSKSHDNDSKTVFRYNEQALITTLDPALAKDQSIYWPCNQIYNGLVQMDDTLHVQPCIAKNWEISNGGILYTFHLRQDVYFHDNELFTNGKGRKAMAADIAYSLNRIVDRKVASPGAWIFSNVVQDEHGRYQFNAVNDSTFSIRLKRPFPPFLGLLTMQYCSVVPQEVVEHYGKDFRNHPVGTGPFQLFLWKENVKLVLHKNPHYFEKDQGQQLPYLDAISISFINDRQLAFMDFIQGKLEMNNSVEPSFKDELLTHKGILQPKWEGRFRMETMPYLNTEYLGFMVDDTARNFKNNPLSIKAIRQAISYGFDREKMIAYLRNGKGTAGTAGIVPLGLPSHNYENVRGYTYNPEKAKQLLAQAGYPNGQGLPPITLSTTPQYTDLCEYIQGQLNEIGLKIKVDVNQPATQREMVSKQQLAFFRGSWIADYPDAENYLALFYSKNFAPNGPNYSHFKNGLFDKLYEQALSEVDTAKRYTFYRRMDSIVVENAPVVILYYDKAIRLYQNWVSGIQGNPMNQLTLKRVKIEKFKNE